MSSGALILFLAGILISIVAGGLGVGGGVLSVPVIYYFGKVDGFPLDHLPHIAIATSLVISTVASTSATVANLQARRVALPVGFAIMIGTIPGALLGTLIARYLPGRELTLIFASMIFVVGVLSLQGVLGSWYTVWRLRQRKANAEMLYDKEKLSSADEMAKQLLGSDGMPVIARRRLYALPGFGVAIGALASLTGVGGGVVMVPLFRKFLSMPIQRAIPASSFVIIATTTAGSIGYMFQMGPPQGVLEGAHFGYLYFPYLIPLLSGAVLGGFIGARVTARSRQDIVRFVFGLLQVGVSIHILLGTLK